MIKNLGWVYLPTLTQVQTISIPHGVNKSLESLHCWWRSFIKALQHSSLSLVCFWIFAQPLHKQIPKVKDILLSYETYWHWHIETKLIITLKLALDMSRHFLQETVHISQIVKITLTIWFSANFTFAFGCNFFIEPLVVESIFWINFL